MSIGEAIKPDLYLEKMYNYKAPQKTFVKSGRIGHCPSCILSTATDVWW